MTPEEYRAKYSVDRKKESANNQASIRLLAEITRRRAAGLLVWIPLNSQKKLFGGLPLNYARPQYDSIFDPKNQALLFPSRGVIDRLSKELEAIGLHLVEVPGKGWRSEPLKKP